MSLSACTGRRSLALLSLVAAVVGSCGPQSPRGQETAELLGPPAVPPPITRDYPTTVVVNLETNERTMRLAEAVTYNFWTFGGSVPGPLIRIREGDIVEFHLNNHPSSQHPHNIDLHAVTGPGGGATSSLVAPGQSATFSFKALNPGLYVYHCATTPVGMHVANGMYGLILVEPEGGLPPVDREYYVMQGEIYAAADYGVPGLQPFDMTKALDEEPPYVVFNGEVGALSDDRALAAEVGETVRLFVGNGGPNLISSFHVIGEIFERVWQEAGSAVSNNIQTTLIPAGGAAIVEIETQVPGSFLLVDHALTRAFNKGALGTLRVDGPEDALVYSGRIQEGVYNPEGGTIQSLEATPSAAPIATSIEERLAFGQRLYGQNCASCHLGEGEGVPGVFPPLIDSDFLNADVERAIRTVIDGLAGPITVNSAAYNSTMPSLGLSDEQVANVLTFVYSQWGNSGVVVLPEAVAALRDQVEAP